MAAPWHLNKLGLGRGRRTANSLSRRGCCYPQRRRLLLETLEDRRLLSASSVPADIAAVLLYEHADSRVLVKFGDTVSDADAVRTGATQRLGNTGWWQVPVRSGQGVGDTLASLRKMEGVVLTQPDYRVQATVSPDDSLFVQGCLWGLQNRGAGVCGFSSAKTDADIDADQAWDITVGNGQVVVAVIDSGVDWTHPDLATNIWINPGEVGNYANDGIDNDGNGYVDDVRGWDFANNDNNPMDDNAHGTHVAGTIGAQGNNNGGLGTGMAGVAWNVQIMPLKFLDQDGYGYTSGAIAALNYAVAKGVKISNNSWGGAPYDAALYQAIQNAGENGHLFIAASGNGNLAGRAQNNDSKPYYPASYDLDNIIAVTASDQNDKYSSFGNYGATSVDIAAPGVGIWSTIPFDLDTFDGVREGYARFNGTSMATPHVSGTAALMWSVNPTLSYQAVKQLILDTGESILDTRRPTVTNDRLNAYNAVLAARDLVPNNPPVAANDGHWIDEDTVLNVAAPGVLGNDSDSDGDPLTAVLVAGPANGSLTLGVGGSFTYSPNTNFSGADSFTYKANDGKADSNVATVTITVNPVNDAPVAVDDTATTNVDTAVTIAVLANDSDADGDSLTVNGVGAASSGSAVNNGDGTITYTPPSGFVGEASFDYTVSDGNGETDTATVTVSAQPPVSASFAINDVAKREGRDGRTTTFTFAVTRSGDTSGEVTIYYATSGGTAVAGEDYLTASGSLTFGVGETSKTISVTVYGDSVAEYDETFFVQLKDGPGFGAILATGTGTILNDDKGTPAASARATDAALLSLLDTGSSKKKDNPLLLAPSADQLPQLLVD